jgi:hypothetical protein
VKPNGIAAKKWKAGDLFSKYASSVWYKSAMPAPTASKVSKERTRAPAGKTSIFIRPPVVSPTV